MVADDARICAEVLEIGSRNRRVENHGNGDISMRRHHFARSQSSAPFAWLRWGLLLLVLAGVISVEPGRVAAQDAEVASPTPTLVPDIAPENAIADAAAGATAESSTVEPTIASEDVQPTPDLETPAQPTEAAPADTPTETPTADPTTEPASTARPEDNTEPETGAQAVQTATLRISTVDHNGNPVLGVTYMAYKDNGFGSYHEVVGQASDVPPSDGVAVFQNMPASISLRIWQQALPIAYIPGATDTVLTLSPDEDRTIEFAVQLGGTITVHAEKEDGDPFTGGACVYAYVNDGGKRGAQAGGGCDNVYGGPYDGVAVIYQLPTGSYLLAPSMFETGGTYEGGPDVPVSVQLGGTAEATVVYTPKGTIAISKRTAGGAPLVGACFTIFRDQGNGNHGDVDIGGGCDSDADGELSFPAPAGDLVIVETQVPYGYVAAEKLRVTIASGETKSFTVVDPLASRLVVATTDLWGNPVRRTCLLLNLANEDGSPGDYYGERCVESGVEIDNTIEFDLLPPGRYLLTLTGAAPGYYRSSPAVVDVGLAETKHFNLPLNGPKPKLHAGPILGRVTQTSMLIYWETDQPTVGTVEYGRSSSLGSVSSTSPEAKVHRVTISGLQAGRTYHFRTQSTNPNGAVRSLTFYLTTPGSGQTARLLLTKTNSDGTQRLGGACFSLYVDSGGGVPGAYAGETCDKFDAAPNDGRMEINGLAAGSYVLVETRSPAGYSLARNLSFSLTSGQTKRITVKDTRGGAVLTVTTEGFTGSSDMPLVPGSCYAVFANVNGQVGPIVAWACDEFDGLDGKTALGGLRIGKYFLMQSITPDGYLPGQRYWEIDVRSGQRTASFRHILQSETEPGNVIVQAADQFGNLLPGACFALYEVVSGPDSLVGSACDADDNHLDGRTVFSRIEASRYSVKQYVAPAGYRVGASINFTKTDNRLRTLKVTQVLGGVTVKVTTTRGSATTKLPGACYSLFKSTGDREYVTGACDGNNDGVVDIVGVPAGTFILVQTTTPSGYLRPADRTIAVGTRTVSFTFATQPRRCRRGKLARERHCRQWRSRSLRSNR